MAADLPREVHGLLWVDGQLAVRVVDAVDLGYPACLVAEDVDAAALATGARADPALAERDGGDDRQRLYGVRVPEPSVVGVLSAGERIDRHGQPRR